MKLSPDEQIDAIVRLMVTGQWKGAASHRKLAEEWSCHPRTVGDRAVAASAVVRRAGGPLEDWVLAKLAELDQVKLVAMQLQKPVVVDGVVQLFNAPDVKAAAMAIKLQMEARGVFVKRVQEVPADEVAKMTREQKLAAHRQAIAELETEGKDGMH